MLVGYLLAKIGQSASSQCLVGVRLFLPCVGFLRKREWDLDSDFGQTDEQF